jgi:hypothetical protein
MTEMNGSFQKMIRFILNLIALLFERGWTFPQFIIRPARLLFEAGFVMSTVFVGRQGVGKTFALALEFLEQIKANPDQPFFLTGRAVLSTRFFSWFCHIPEKTRFQQDLSITQWAEDK